MYCVWIASCHIVFLGDPCHVISFYKIKTIPSTQVKFLFYFTLQLMPSQLYEYIFLEVSFSNFWVCKKGPHPPYETPVVFFVHSRVVNLSLFFYQWISCMTLSGKTLLINLFSKLHSFQWEGSCKTNHIEHLMSTLPNIPSHFTFSATWPWRFNFVLQNW